MQSSNSSEGTSAATVTKREARFSLGRLAITAEAKRILHPEDTQTGLARHARGDWGECSEADVQANDFAVLQRLRMLSVYRDRNGTRFWIITEADRSGTTVLLPEDY
jgi:hypothetical protein